MSQTRQPQSIFPDYPRDQPLVDKGGSLIAQWDTQLSALFQALQQNFKNEGILFPPLTTTQRNTIQALYTPYIGSPLPQDAGSQVYLPDISGQTVLDSVLRSSWQFVITYDSSTPPNVSTAQWVML